MLRRCRVVFEFCSGVKSCRASPLRILQQSAALLLADVLFNVFNIYPLEARGVKLLLLLGSFYAA